jgi:hypothetical protein
MGGLRDRFEEVGGGQLGQRFAERRVAARVEAGRVEGVLHRGVVGERLDQGDQVVRPQEGEATVAVVVRHRAERLGPQRHLRMQPVRLRRVERGGRRGRQ